MTEIWNAALYIRLSQDDKDKNISNSVLSQKKILEEYVMKAKNDVFNIIDSYIDDGYTGTSFVRPGFIRMMDDMRKDNVNCIIVKDLSRFGREHIDVDNYLERIFPLMNIRFISIMQQIDSFKYPSKMNSIEIPFLNLINEEYARDISRKTLAGLEAKRRQGKYVAVNTPYGYLRDEQDKNKLIRDINTVQIVRNIFNWYIDGMNLNEISKQLNNLSILSPLAYSVSIGKRKKPINNDTEKYILWKAAILRNILNNPIYTGDMVQGKTASLNFKIKQRVQLPKDKWIIVKNTHEAIITHDTFDAVQNLLYKNQKTKTKKAPSVFARYLICADCGKYMVRTTSIINGKKYCKFVCSTSKKYGIDICSSHIISEDVLIEIVLACLQKQIDCAVDIEDVVKNISKSDACKRQYAYNENEYNNINEAIRYNNNLKQGLYEDYKTEFITIDEYNFMKGSYLEKHTVLNDKLSKLKVQMANITKSKTASNIFITSFKEYRNITEISRACIVALVEEITVYKNKEIKIKFKYQDDYKKLISIFAV